MLEHLESLLEKFRGKKVAFLGLGRTNLPLVYLFYKHAKDYGIEILALDYKKDEADPEVKKLKELNIEIRLGQYCLKKLDMDVIFRSPGIYLFSEDLVRAEEEGIFITSETEEFFCLHPCKIIAVTGSDGKTTTTTLISEILKNACFKIHLGGNIGNPLLNRIENIKSTDITVVELSSFQLISMNYSPDIAVFTNISPNHLDVHKDLEEYIEAKKNILVHQKNDSLAVLNIQTEIEYNLSSCCRGKVLYFGSCDFSNEKLDFNFLENANNETKKSDIFFNNLYKENFCKNNKGEIFATNLNTLKKENFKEIFSKILEKKEDFGSKKGSFTFIKENFNKISGALEFFGNLYFFDGDNTQFVIEVRDIKLKGKHNIQNCLAAICATYSLVPLKAIVKTLKEFSGVEHRIEFVCKKNGVTYINDSIATTPTRTIKGALSLFCKKIILIAGGHDKKVPFKELAKNIIDKVKVLILMGETAKKISFEIEVLLNKKNNSSDLKIFFVKNMEEAVDIAKKNAIPGDVIVLSPACSSFDLYKNFEERGNHFKRLVSKKIQAKPF